MEPHPAPVPRLWAEFSAPLRAFVGRRTPPGIDPDDVLQEIFVRIQERVHDLRDSERIDAWIFQIARNILVDGIRTRRRHDALVDRAAADLAMDAAAADERSAAAELSPCLAPMIARLPAPYREAIELTELRGLTQSEAARVAGLSLSGMKSRVQRGREQLKAMLLACCWIETDVRGGVVDYGSRAGCDRVRPSETSGVSMNMQGNHSPSPTPDNQAASAERATDAPAPGCCGGPAPAGAAACCALDAEVKSTGGAGCGCAATPAPPQVQAPAPAPAPAKKGSCS